jgi:hypothetical protein
MEVVVMSPSVTGVDLVRKRVEERTSPAAPAAHSPRLADADAPQRLDVEGDAPPLRAIGGDNALPPQSDTTPAKPRWVTPLTEFIGTDEPDDDDSEDWIIRDIIPRGEPALFAGPPKSGKTWTLLDLAIAVATGEHWLDGAQKNTLGRPGRVLVIALEDGARRLIKRIWELARGRGLRPVDDPTLTAHLSVTRAPLRLPDRDDEREFAAELRRWRPDLVLIDNLTRVMVGDQNAIKDVAAFTKLWAQMCTDLGAAFDYLHHTGKAGPVGPGRDSRDPFELVRGSGDLVAAARNVIVMRPLRPDDDAERSDGPLMAELRIRGNLDLRRDALVVGFERRQGEDGRWSTRLRDMGDATAVRAEIATKRKEAGAAKRKADAAAKTARRREIALDIARRSEHKACSSADLGHALDLSPRAAAPVLAALVREGLMTADRMLGYVLVGGDGGDE